MKNSPTFFSFLGLFFLQLQLHISSSTYPIDFVLSSDCKTNSDCTHYRYSRCNDQGKCDKCETKSDCLHISQDPGVDCELTSSSGSESFKFCRIPCSDTNKEACIGMRSHCVSTRCQFCSTDTQCKTEGYPGDTAAWCNKLGTFPVCSSCPKTAGCPGKSECKNFKCTECSSDDDCGGSTPFCERKFEGDFCRACYKNDHCPTVAKSKCSANNCIKCTGDPDCTHITGKPKCHASKGCLQCYDHTHCPGGYCSEDDKCVECLENGHCASGRCVGNTCVACIEHSDCADNTKPYCIENICQNAIYRPTCSPTYHIQVLQINDKRQQFDLLFPSELASKVDIKATLTITLLNIPQSDYTYTLNKMSKTSYQVIFAIQTSIPATKLRLQLPCPTQSGYLFGDIILDTNTKFIAYTTPEIQETVETIKDFASTTTNIMAGASGSMMLAGANPAIMWALIELLQAFYYMIFINVQYPVNVQAFFGLFALGNLSFIPNPIEWFFPDIDDVDLQAPEKFLENDVDGLFLQTAGNMLLTWFLVLVGYIVSKLFLKFTRNMPKLLNTAASKTIEIFEWSGVIRTLLTSYTQLSMAAFLQIRVLNFDRKLYGVSSLTGIAFTAFAFLFPPFTIFLIRKFSKRPNILKAKYSTLTEEFKYDKSKLTPLYFTAFFIIRRLALTLALVFLHSYPYLEVVFLLLNCVIWLILLVKYLPYDDKKNNIVNIISEFLFIVIHVIFFFFAHDDHKDWLTDQKKLDLGWVIIGCCGVILGLTLIVSFIEQYYAAKNLIKLLIKVIKGKKDPSFKVKRKGQPQVHPEKTENTLINTSTDQLENSMTVMPLVPLHTISPGRRRINRPQIRYRNRYNIKRSPLTNL